MNGFNLAQYFMLFGGLGGLACGLPTYGGLVFPSSVDTEIPTPHGRKNIAVKMWMPGVVGSVGLGVLNGLVLFLYFQKDTWPFQAVGLTGRPMGLWFIGAVALGLSGTFLADELIARVQSSGLTKKIEFAKGMDQGGQQSPPPAAPASPPSGPGLLDLEQLSVSRRPSAALARMLK